MSEEKRFSFLVLFSFYSLQSSRRIHTFYWHITEGCSLIKIACRHWFFWVFSPLIVCWVGSVPMYLLHSHHYKFLYLNHPENVRLIFPRFFCWNKKKLYICSTKCVINFWKKLIAAIKYAWKILISMHVKEIDSHDENIWWAQICETENRYLSELQESWFICYHLSFGRARWKKRDICGRYNRQFPCCSFPSSFGILMNAWQNPVQHAQKITV